MTIMSVNFIYDNENDAIYEVSYCIIISSIIISSIIISSRFCTGNSQTLPTEKGTLDVKMSYEEIIPGEQTRLNIDFINPQSQSVQEHIDYRITVIKDDGKTIFGPIPLTHTSMGSVSIPVEFTEEGNYSVDFEVEGILFQPIPLEKVSFDVIVGKASAQPPVQVNDGSESSGGGCLIATAAYGSEMAPQIQQLRELRDNTLLATNSGTTFMNGFNQIYYSFSPSIADFEREQPIFKEFIKITLTPMISSLSILNYVNMDSEEEVLTYGISIVLLNIGMYLGIPVFGILKFYQFKRK